jgi:DNA modification methylase
MRSVAASLKLGSQYKVFDAIQMKEAIEEVPQIANASTRHKAKKLLKMATQTALIKARIANKEPSEIDSNFVNADCRDYLKTIPDESVDCILTDPPFGIDIEKITRSGIGAFGGVIYQEDDTKEGVLSLLDEVIPELFRVLKPDSHLHMFFAYPHYQVILSMLEKVGFDVSPIPNIWRKEGASGQTNRPEKWFGSCYEPIFFAHKGLRPLAYQGKPNIFSFSLVKQTLKKHPLEKPISLLQSILSFSCEPGDTVLDPFAGVGTVLQAAYLSRINYLGCEIDKGYWAHGQEELSGFSGNPNVNKS